MPCIKQSETSILVKCGTIESELNLNYQITIHSLTNSLWAYTDILNVNIRTYNEAGDLLDQTDAGNIPLKYSSITLPSTAVTLTSGNGAVAGQYTYLDVKIAIESPVPQGGKVEI